MLPTIGYDLKPVSEEDCLGMMKKMKIGTKTRMKMMKSSMLSVLFFFTLVVGEY